MRAREQYDTSSVSKENHFATLKRLGSHLWPDGRIDLKVRVVVAMVCLFAAKVVSVYMPVLYKMAVDSLSPVGENLAVVLPLSVILSYGLARVLNAGFGELRDFLFIKVAQHAQRSLALSTFKHLHRLSLRFHLDRQTGGLSRVIERALKGIQFVLSFMLFNILPTLLELFMVMGILYFYFDWRFSAVTVGTIVLYIGFTLAVTEWRLKYRREMNQRDTTANTKAIDSLINFETVKYFGNEEHEYKRYDNSLEGYERAAVQSQGSLSLLNVGQSAFIGGGMVSLMYLSASGVVSGIYTVGDFVLANTYMMQLFMPLNFLGFVYREMKQGLIDMDKMFELLNINQEIEDKNPNQHLQVSSGKIEFKDINFSYNDDRQILRGVDFEAEPGQTVAIVGPSGSGKSTISRLLFRFYDPQNGTIKIDDQDIANVTQTSLRQSIGVVPQDTVLFNDTIGYNIRYGNPRASEEEVVEAARLAQIYEFIMGLPEGFDTKVGERGLKLSGGEKQRVAIARTILKKPKILLFDEATSALDSQTENEIQASLNEVSKGRTTLVIAHRLSTIVEADKIIVLNEGRLIEEGKHKDLLAVGGEYYQMWNRQQEAKVYEQKLQKCLES